MGLLEAAGRGSAKVAELSRVGMRGSDHERHPSQTNQLCGKAMATSSERQAQREGPAGRPSPQRLVQGKDSPSHKVSRLISPSLPLGSSGSPRCLPFGSSGSPRRLEPYSLASAMV